jgi:hypothetical protein
MGIFGAIKNRFLGRKDELGDIRSHVLSEGDYEREYPERDFSDREEPRMQEVPTLPELPEPPKKRFGSPTEPRFAEPGLSGRFEEPNFAKEPLSMEEPTSGGGNYELMDRLNIIEAQLTAIRSQTETINERLKNMEMRMGRRY